MKKPILIFTLFAVTLLSLLVFSACSDTGFRHVDFQEFEVTLLTQDPVSSEIKIEIVTTNHRQVDVSEPEQRLGCDFEGWYMVDGVLNGKYILGAKWEKQFPVKRAGLVLFARWKPKEEMKYFEFVSTKDTCKIVSVNQNAPADLFVPYYVTEFGSDHGANLRSVFKVTFEEGSQLKSISDKAFYMCSLFLHSIKILGN